MKKNSIYFDLRSSYPLMGIVAALCLMLTGCCCGDEITNENVRQVLKDEQSLVGRENLYGNKTGIISLREETKVAPAKNLASCCNVPPVKPNPLGIRSARTYITGGPNINFKSAGDDVYAEGSHKPGIGFQFGFRTEYRFNDNWSVVPGLLYKKNNASEEGEIRDGEPPAPAIDIKDKYSYSYLSAPILAQYNLTEELTLLAGPELNYLLKSKVKSNLSYGGDTQEEDTDLTDNSVKIGLGVQVGLKYEFPDSRWGIELIYDHRISRLNKKNPEGYGNYEVPAWRMKSVQLGVTCKICDLVGGKKNQGTNNK
jgi:hypothetical protein